MRIKTAKMWHQNIILSWHQQFLMPGLGNSCRNKQTSSVNIGHCYVINGVVDLCLAIFMTVSWRVLIWTIKYYSLRNIIQNGEAWQERRWGFFLKRYQDGLWWCRNRTGRMGYCHHSHRLCSCTGTRIMGKILALFLVCFSECRFV